MLSYVVCKGSDSRFDKLAYPPLHDQCIRYGAELIIVEDSASIFRAYEQGRTAAKHDIIVYLHDDAVILDSDTTPRIVEAFANDPRLGLVGVLGSAETDTLPWWTNITSFGHCFYPKYSRFKRHLKDSHSVYVYSTRSGNLWGKTLPVSMPIRETWEALPKGSKWKQTASAGLVDGVLMAERRNDIPWDTTAYTGWHAYDADRSLQVAAAGYTIAVCDLLVRHCPQPHDQAWLINHTDNIKVACEKWGLKQGSMVTRWLSRLNWPTGVGHG